MVSYFISITVCILLQCKKGKDIIIVSSREVTNYELKEKSKFIDYLVNVENTMVFLIK